MPAQPIPELDDPDDMGESWTWCHGDQDDNPTNPPA